MTNMNQSTAVVKRVIMIKTGSYADQYIRPFTATVGDQNVLNLFVENTHGGANIDPANIAVVAGQMLQPTAMVSGVAQIMGGWSQSRIRFFIEAEFTTQMGIKHTYLVQGYSDQPGFTQSGLIDPNMLLFMNNVVILQEQAYVDPATGMMSRRMIDTSQVLFRQPAMDMSGFNPHAPRMQTMLPSEVIQNIGITELQNTFGPSVISLNNALDISPVVKSARKNAVASRYLANSVTVMTAAVNEQGAGAPPLIDLTNRASALIPEAPLSQDKFISLISERTPFRENGYIYWRDLTAIFPTIDAVTICVDREFQQQLARANNNVQMGAVTSIAHDTTRDIRNLESWMDAGRETIVANTLGYAVPAVMMECFIAGLSFTVTNMTHDGQPKINILHRDTFLDNMDLTPYLQRFVNVLLSEILMNVSYGNAHSYNISMNVNILGDTYLNIALNGGIGREYLMPTFCDALTVPIVTHNPLDKDNLSAGIFNLSNAVRGNQDYLANVQTNPFLYTPAL